MRLRKYFNIILDFELRCSTNWEYQRIGQKAWLRARFVCEKPASFSLQRSSMSKAPCEWKRVRERLNFKFKRAIEKEMKYSSHI